MTRYVRRVVLGGVVALLAFPALGLAAPVLSGPSVTNTDPVLTWTDGDGATLWDVFRGATCPAATSIALGVAVLTHTDSGLADGTYCYRVDSTDGAAAGASNTVSVTIDTVPPTFSPTLPTDDSFVRGTVSVPYTASGASTIVLEYDPPGVTSWQPAASGATPLTWDTTIGGDVTYGLRAVATDAAGNATTVTRTTIKVDNTLATATVNLPGAGLQQHGAVALSANVADGAGSGVGSVEFHGDGPGANAFTLSAAIASGVATATWTPVPGEDGSWTISVETTDVVGNNDTAAASVTVQTDNTAPTAASFGALPANNTKLGGPISITFSAPADDGSGIERVELQTSPAVANTWTTRDTDIASLFTSVSWTPMQADDDLYDFRLVAFDLAGNPAASGLRLNLRVDNFAPIRPTALNAPLYTGVAPALTWPASASGDVVGYELSRGATLLNGGSPVTGTSFTDLGIPLDGSADGQYTYTIRAFDGALYSLSRTRTVTIDTVRPSAPTTPRARLHATQQSVLLDWAESSDPNAPNGEPGTGVMRYMVRRLPAPAVPSSPSDGEEVCPPVLAGSSSCTDTTPAEETSYRYAIFALDLAGNASLAAATASVTVPDRTFPGSPGPLRAKAKGTKIVLTWKLPTAADLDRVVVVRNARRAPRNLTDGTRVYSGKAVTVSRVQTAGTAVYYRVFAVDDADNVSASKAVRVRLPVFGLFPESGSDVRGAVKLRWKRVARANYYNVQIYEAGRKIVDTWPTGTSFRLAPARLTAGRTYTWYVWPGFGAKAAAKYGPRIGKSTFVWLG